MASKAEQARDRSVATLWNIFLSVQPDIPREHVEALVDDLDEYHADSAKAEVMAELRQRGIVK